MEENREVPEQSVYQEPMVKARRSEKQLEALRRGREARSKKAKERRATLEKDLDKPVEMTIEKPEKKVEVKDAEEYYESDEEVVAVKRVKPKEKKKKIKYVEVESSSEEEVIVKRVKSQPKVVVEPAKPVRTRVPRVRKPVHPKQEEDPYLSIFF